MRLTNTMTNLHTNAFAIRGQCGEASPSPPGGGSHFDAISSLSVAPNCASLCPSTARLCSFPFAAGGVGVGVGWGGVGGGGSKELEAGVQWGESSSGATRS